MATATNRQLLTHSRQDAFKRCRRRAWFSYELGVRPVEDAKALRMGSAWHDALEMIGNGEHIDAAYGKLYQTYLNLGAFAPDYERAEELAYEFETVARLLYGYAWRWQDDELEWVACEHSFQIPLVNPATGKASQTFMLAGKIDGIVRHDGRLLVMEHKLLSDDLASDSKLWDWLKIDSQITVYMLAARHLGYAVEGVLYNVTRKPTIKPTPIPVLDDDGLKIVVDRDGNRVRNKSVKPKKSCDLCRGAGVVGEKHEDCPCTYGSWRQTASAEDGYTLLSRPMTHKEWGEKLTTDIGERPEFYYARHEIARLDQDMDEYQRELWDIAKAYREAQRSNAFYRTAHKDTCGFCPYFGLCTSGWNAGDSLPEHFTIVEDIHPELSR